MKCNPFPGLFSHIRYFLFPASKLIDKRTKEIDHSLLELREQKAQTSEMVSRVNQPDVLRSLVISMNKNPGGH